MISWNQRCPDCNAPVGIFSCTPKKVIIGSGTGTCASCKFSFPDGSLEWDDMSTQEKVELFIPFRNYALWFFALGLPILLSISGEMPLSQLSENFRTLWIAVALVWLIPQALLRAVQIGKSKLRTKSRTPHERSLSAAAIRRKPSFLTVIAAHGLFYGGMGVFLAAYVWCVFIARSLVREAAAGAGMTSIPVVLYALGGMVILLLIIGAIAIPIAGVVWMAKRIRRSS